MTLIVLNKEQSLAWIDKQLEKKGPTVWDRFNYIGDDYYVCKNCNQQVYFKSIWALITHRCDVSPK